MATPAPATTLDARAWGGFRLVPVLLAARLRMVSNAGLRSGRERRGWTVLLAAGAAAAMVLGFRTAVVAFDASDPAPATLEPLAAGICAMVGGFTAVTAVTFALTALYFARDLEGLLVTPLPPRSIVLTKLAIQLGTGAAIGAALAGPPLAAYLLRHGALLALPWVGMCVVAMAVYPLVAGTVMAVVVVRLLPARRVRDAGGLLVTATVFGVTAVNLAVRGPETFTTTPSLLDPSRSHGAADAAWLPTGWAARAVAAAVRGEVASTVAWGLPMVAGAAIALLVAARMLEAPFLTGYQRSQEAARGRRRRRGLGARGNGGRGRRPPWLVLATKDLRETLRDASQLGQLILPLALFALYIASPTSVGVTRTADLPRWFGALLTAGFASLFAASGVGLRGIGMEGRRMWLLRVAPIEARSVLIAKYISAAAVAVILGLVLLGIGIGRLRLGFTDAVVATGELVTVVSGLVGLAVGMGAVRPRLDWTDPRRSIGIGTSLSFLAAGSVYIGTCFVLLALPYGRTPQPGAGSIALAWGAVLALALTAVLIPLRLATARLRTLEL